MLDSETIFFSLKTFPKHSTRQEKGLKYLEYPKARNK